MNHVKYSDGKPPNNLYKRCRERFGKYVDWDNGVVFTYGDTIYSKTPISDHLKIHEEIHIHQQLGLGKDVWWDKYFTDRDFRLSQELEAYIAELKYLNKNYSRQYRKKIENHIYFAMANLYDFGLSEKESKELLK